jgi:glutamate/tyrosine decarboxylase-like PLP-dependent enzyme
MKTMQQPINYHDLDTFFRMISDYFASANHADKKVVNYLEPDALRKEIDLTVKENGGTMSELLQSVEKYLAYAVNTGNKQFFNQLYSGHNLPAFMGEVVAAATNTSMYTYEVAPVATLIENEMIAKMLGIAGFPDGEGLFLTGGSNANLIAMFSARNRKMPRVKTGGLMTEYRLAAFVSDQSHYSFETSANMLGLGSDAVYKVKTDPEGRMLPSELEHSILKARLKGEVPFFVAATAATTMLGAFDPFEDIALLARKYDLWMHVDGAFGGSLILSDEGKHLFHGLGLADSFAWNPHKLMNIPLICSVILTREKGQLRNNLTNLHDDYIFHDTDTGDLDLGKKSVQCGRRVDAVKLWTAWKYFGDVGYARRMNKLLNLAAYFEQRVIDDPRLELLAPRQSLTVCFRYITENHDDINLFNETLREHIRKSGQALVNYGTINQSFAFRWVVANPDVETEDIDRFFEILLEAATKLDVPAY